MGHASTLEDMVLFASRLRERIAKPDSRPEMRAFETNYLDMIEEGFQCIPEELRALRARLHDPASDDERAMAAYVDAFLAEQDH